MAVNLACLYRNTLPTSSGTLFTASGTNGVEITDITIANNNSTSVTVTINVDGIVLVPGVSVDGNTVVPIGLKQYVANTKLVTGVASASGVGCHISGANV